MKAILKQYSIALGFLLFTIILMLGGTMAVMRFGESMVQDMGIEMKPRGENLNQRSENK